MANIPVFQSGVKYPPLHARRRCILHLHSSLKAPRLPAMRSSPYRRRSALVHQCHGR